MLRNDRMNRGWVAIVGCLVVGALTGCSATVSKSAPTGASTTAPGAASKSPGTSASSGKTVTLATLELFLPVAAAVGPDYKIDTDKSDNTSDPQMDAALAKACPEANKLFGGSTSDNNAKSPDRSFVTADGRTMEIEYDLSKDEPNDPSTPAQVTKYVNAINQCSTIVFTEKGGTHFSMKLSAQSDTAFAPIGMIMNMDMELSGGQLPGTVPASGRVRMFRSGAVDVNVTATSGFDANFQETPPDFSVLDALAGDAADKVEAVQH